MSRTIYNKIEEEGRIYRIHASIRKTSLSLVILEEDNSELNAYETSVILEPNLKKQADQLGISLDNYYDNLIFFLENPQKVKFIFNKNSLSILKSVNSNLKAKYFHCNLHKAENFSLFIGNFIDEIQERTSKAQEKNYELAGKCSLFEKEVGEYKTKLNELVKRKNVDEQVMLSNFVSLLNEKKRRIQHLNELLEAFKTNPSLANPVEVNINCRKKRKIFDFKSKEPSSSRVKEEVSDSSVSSNYEHNTSDSETNETVAVKSEISVPSECLDDIFDESPKPLLTLPSISRKPNSSRNVTAMAIESSNKNEKFNMSTTSVNSDKTELQQSNCLNNTIVDINTQDWLDIL